MADVAMVVIIVVVILLLAVSAAILCAAAALIVMILPGHPSLNIRTVALLSTGTYIVLIPMLSVLSQR